MTRAAKQEGGTSDSDSGSERRDVGQARGEAPQSVIAQPVGNNSEVGALIDGLRGTICWIIARDRNATNWLYIEQAIDRIETLYSRVKELEALLGKARHGLDDAEGWLAINSGVNRDELCARLQETIAKIYAPLGREEG